MGEMSRSTFGSIAYSILYYHRKKSMHESCLFYSMYSRSMYSGTAYSPEKEKKGMSHVSSIVCIVVVCIVVYSIFYITLSLQ